MLDGFDAIGHTFVLYVPLKRQQILVAVAARNAQGRAADQHARSGNVAGIDGIAQGDVSEAAGAHVANGRKPGFERDPGIARSSKGLARHGNRQARIAKVGSERDVGVRVDQSRQHGGVGKLDHRGVLWQELVANPSHLADLVSLNDDGLAGQRLPGFHVKQVSGVDDHRLRRGRCLRPGKADTGKRKNKRTQMTAELHSIPQ